MTVRVGILGCARIAKAAMIDAAPLVPGIEIAAVASRDAQRAVDYAREHSIPVSHGSYEALIADPRIDAVYIPLPNGLHAEWSIRALSAGKAVICEKPFASNAAAARRMADCARTSGNPLMEAVHYRFHPLAQRIDEIMASGTLGRIERIDAGLEIPGELVDRDDIRFQPDLAGGAMMDLGTYCLSAQRWIAGEEPEVLGAEAQLIAPQMDKSMRVQLAFPSGPHGAFTCSLAAKKIRAWLTVTGSGGRLHVDNPFLPQLGHRGVLEVDGESSTFTCDPTPTYVFQAAAFAAVCRGEIEPLITLRESIANMEVIDAIYRKAGLAPRA